MTKQEFSHKMLTMLIANRSQGSIGRFLDQLNEFTKAETISEEQRDEIIAHLEQFFVDEHKVFTQFSEKVKGAIGFNY